MPASELTSTLQRRFYRLESSEPTPDSWDVLDEGRTLTLFWADLTPLPQAIEPQDQWLAEFQSRLREA